MELPGVTRTIPIYHDLRGSFGRVLEASLRGHKVAVANGPLYDVDPATALIEPFMRSAKQTGWKIDAEEQLAPPHVLKMSSHLRVAAAKQQYEAMSSSSRDMILDDWARAGVVLEIASRRGVRLRELGVANVRWKLKSTVTGRFGAEMFRGPGGWTFSPLTIAATDRWRLVPNGVGRRLVSLDFKGMDIWSMLAVVPGMAAKYKGCTDPHVTTGRILLGHDPSPGERDILKQQIFVHAYGGSSQLREAFEEKLPELGFLRAMRDGAGARLIQTTSALAFRAALATAMPNLVHDDVRPVIAVHDELVLDVLDGHEELAERVRCDLETGAKNRLGQPYQVGASWGSSYEECKS